MSNVTVIAPMEINVVDDETCDNQCPHFTFNDEERAMCSLFNVGLGISNPYRDGEAHFARCFGCRDGEQK